MLVWKRLFRPLSLLLGNVYVKLDCACPSIRRERLLDCLISRAKIQNGAQLEGKTKLQLSICHYESVKNGSSSQVIIISRIFWERNVESSIFINEKLEKAPLNIKLDIKCSQHSGLHNASLRGQLLDLRSRRFRESTSTSRSCRDYSTQVYDAAFSTD